MSWTDSLLYREGRLRPAFRIGLFFLLFFLFGSAGQYVIAVLPRHPLQWGSLAAMTIAALLAGWIVLTRIDGRPFGALGFALDSRAAPEFAGGFAIGGGLIAVAIVLLFVTGSATLAPDVGSVPSYLGFLGWTLIFFALAATFEEVVFRGYPYQALVEWVGVWPATIFMSGLFAALHGQNPEVNALGLVNIFVAGIFLSFAYLKTRSLWFATGIHLGWNWTMASLFDFPVSGLGFETPLYTGVPTGPAWWTGGAFGPEAGLAGTILLLLGLGWLLWTHRIRPAARMASLRPIVEPRLQGAVFR